MKFADYDIESFSRDNAHKIPETANAFANSSGGKIICSGFNPENLIPPEIPRTSKITGSTTEIYISPLEWNKRPLTLDGKVYRRIEGVNVISGLTAKSIMALDALEFSRDDFPVSNINLDEDCLNDFHEKIIERHENFLFYDHDEFLRRCGVYSGKYLTFAGALMFGDILKIRAVLDYSGGHAEIVSSNIWRAYNDMLPRLTAKLSGDCALAFTEIFINALIHSDYNFNSQINIVITPYPLKVLIDNPGTVRGTVRNHRLKRIFSLSGIKHNKLHGLDTVYKYMPSFRLEQDMLNLRTLAVLELEGRKELPEPVIL